MSSFYSAGQITERSKFFTGFNSPTVSPHVVEGVKKFKDKSSLSPRDIFMTLLLFLLLNESWKSVPSLLMQHDFLADDLLVP